MIKRLVVIAFLGVVCIGCAGNKQQPINYEPSVADYEPPVVNNEPSVVEDTTPKTNYGGGGSGIMIGGASSASTMVQTNDAR